MSFEGPATFVSPHLDDAVMSCGQLIAATESTVHTICTRRPQQRLATDYDRGCGFPTSAQAVMARREEDRHACSTLHARVVHANLFDSQYRPLDLSGVADILSRLSGNVFVPLGLGHPDHQAIAETALDVHLAGDTFQAFWLYEELPYRVHLPEEAVARVDELRQRGLTLELQRLAAGPVDVKAEAVRCYRSQTHQLGDLGNEHSWLVPERYWRVIR